MVLMTVGKMDADLVALKAMLEVDKLAANWVYETAVLMA